MIVIPRKLRNQTDSNGRVYIGGRIVYDNTTQMSEIEKKMNPYITKLNSLVKEVDTEIKQSSRRAKELLEAFPKKVEIEIEATKNRTSLYTTKMNVLKLIISSLKDIKDAEMKERKLIFDLTGKNVDIKGGNVNTKALIAGQMERSAFAPRKALGQIESYGHEILGDEDAPEAVKVNVQGEEAPKHNPAIERKEEAQNSSTQSEAKTDGNFTSLFGEVAKPDSSKYIAGNDNMKSYEKMDERFSYGSAETGLKNKYLNKTEQKCHWDKEENVGWIRTYDTSTGEIVDTEAYVPPQLHGKITLAKSGGDIYAIDEIDNNYPVVFDSVDNVPEVIKKELMVVYGREAGELDNYEDD